MSESASNHVGNQKIKKGEMGDGEKEREVLIWTHIWWRWQHSNHPSSLWGDGGSGNCSWCCYYCHQPWRALEIFWGDFGECCGESSLGRLHGGNWALYRLNFETLVLLLLLGLWVWVNTSTQLWCRRFGNGWHLFFYLCITLVWQFGFFFLPK